MEKLEVELQKLDINDIEYIGLVLKDDTLTWKIYTLGSDNNSIEGLDSSVTSTLENWRRSFLLKCLARAWNEKGIQRLDIMFNFLNAENINQIAHDLILIDFMPDKSSQILFGMPLVDDQRYSSLGNLEIEFATQLIFKFHFFTKFITSTDDNYLTYYDNSKVLSNLKNAQVFEDFPSALDVIMFIEKNFR